MPENSAGIQAETRVKVWRPQGFPGVEVECFDNLSDLVIEPLVMQGYEFTVAIQGSAKLRYAGEKYEWKDLNQLFLAQHPGELASLDARGEQAVSAWNLRLSPEAITSLLSEFGQAKETLYFPEMTVADALNNSLALLLKEAIVSFDRPHNHLECETKLLSLVYAVLKYCSDTPPPEVKPGKEHRAVTLVKEVLHTHPEQDHHLADLATLARLNKVYLHKVFKRDVGVSPHEYQTTLRIGRAKALLAAGEPVAQVALSTGFTDQSHLTRTFRRYTQTTPGRFQRYSLET